MYDNEKRLAQCQRVIGYFFADTLLLETALTHSSLRSSDRECNERLEFLGDSVLGLVITEELYRQLPESAEGEMTRIKSAVVSRSALYSASTRLGLADFADYARGVGRDDDLPTSVVANLFEAVIGAIYLDAGYYPSREFVLRHLGSEIEDTLNDRGAKNHKSMLQHEVQQAISATPHYRTVEAEGPDHDRVFVVAAVIQGREWGRASGANKKEAEQEAARLASEAWARRGRGRRRRRRKEGDRKPDGNGTLREPADGATDDGEALDGPPPAARKRRRRRGRAPDAAGGADGTSDDASVAAPEQPAADSEPIRARDTERASRMAPSARTARRPARKGAAAEGEGLDELAVRAADPDEQRPETAAPDVLAEPPVAEEPPRPRRRRRARAETPAADGVEAPEQAREEPRGAEPAFAAASDSAPPPPPPPAPPNADFFVGILDESELPPEPPAHPADAEIAEPSQSVPARAKAPAPPSYDQADDFLSGL